LGISTKAIIETLRKRASAHHRISRKLYAAAKTLPVSVEVLGDTSAAYFTQVRMLDHLRGQLRWAYDVIDKLEDENKALAAKIHADDPAAEAAE
jgi:hypothetical protein